MRSPTCSELPSPPRGKTGWPWTEESQQLPDAMPGGSPWPKVSIVTPSYNQGQFIEETIRSVLLQGYPNLEYIIIDGGSTDGSVRIIQRYEPWLAHWVSEPDRGQAHAINKGWRRARGRYLSWLNSDDLLLPHSLQHTVWRLTKSARASIVYGSVLTIDAGSRVTGKGAAKPFRLEDMVVRWQNPVRQPGFLMRASLLEDVGYLRERFQFTMDFEYWVRIALAGKSGIVLRNAVAAFRRHQGAKTSHMQRQRINDRFAIYDAVFSLPLPSRLKGKMKESRSNLHLNAAHIAYRDGDTRFMRRHALKHVLLSGVHSSLQAWIILGLSVAGARSFPIARGLVESIHSLFRRTERT